MLIEISLSSVFGFRALISSHHRIYCIVSCYVLSNFHTILSKWEHMNTYFPSASYKSVGIPYLSYETHTLHIYVHRHMSRSEKYPELAGAKLHLLQLVFIFYLNTELTATLDTSRNGIRFWFLKNFSKVRCTPLLKFERLCPTPARASEA